MLRDTPGFSADALLQPTGRNLNLFSLVFLVITIEIPQLIASVSCSVEMELVLDM